jgi:cob(I)alamin adenosyltransferase
MKVYTKRGDGGKTSMPSNASKRVWKDDKSVVIVGELDELNAAIGILIDQVWDQTNDASDATQLTDPLEIIQDCLFEIGAQIAMGKDRLMESDIEFLEVAIDKMDECMPPLKNFIKPRMTYTHMARAICRRAERSLITMSRKSAIPIRSHLSLIVKYLNRLSDFLFVFGRYMCFEIYEDYQEPVWISKRNAK